MKPLDKNYIIENARCGKFIIDLFPTIDSTNEYLKGLPLEDIPRFCLAEEQTVGRGRQGKSWHSPSGQNIYLSYRYSSQKNIRDLSGLGLIVALAVINTLKKFIPSEANQIFDCAQGMGPGLAQGGRVTPLPPWQSPHCLVTRQAARNKFKIKWPNDVIVDDKKIAGVLVDVQAKSNDSCSVIIGVGLNVNMQDGEENHIAQYWNSMYKITKKSFDRNEICTVLIESLLEYLRKFSFVGLPGFIQEWKEFDYLFGKKTDVCVGEERFIGIAKGINQIGQLQLELPSGEVRVFSSGDASVPLSEEPRAL